MFCKLWPSFLCFWSCLTQPSILWRQSISWSASQSGQLVWRSIIRRQTWTSSHEMLLVVFDRLGYAIPHLVLPTRRDSVILVTASEMSIYVWSSFKSTRWLPSDRVLYNSLSKKGQGARISPKGGGGGGAPPDPDPETETTPAPHPAASPPLDDAPPALKKSHPPQPITVTVDRTVTAAESSAIFSTIIITPSPATVTTTAVAQLPGMVTSTNLTSTFTPQPTVSYHSSTSNFWHTGLGKWEEQGG